MFPAHLSLLFCAYGLTRLMLFNFVPYRFPIFLANKDTGNINFRLLFQHRMGNKYEKSQPIDPARAIYSTLRNGNGIITHQQCIIYNYYYKPFSSSNRLSTLQLSNNTQVIELKKMIALFERVAIQCCNLIIVQRRVSQVQACNKALLSIKERKSKIHTKSIAGYLLKDIKQILKNFEETKKSLF
jgi:hypothetical protein